VFPGGRVALWRQRIAEGIGPKAAAGGEPTEYPARAVASSAAGNTRPLMRRSETGCLKNNLYQI